MMSKRLTICTTCSELQYCKPHIRLGLGRGKVQFRIYITELFYDDFYKLHVKNNRILNQL